MVKSSLGCPPGAFLDSDLDSPARGVVSFRDTLFGTGLAGLAAERWPGGFAAGREVGVEAGAASDFLKNFEMAPNMCGGHIAKPEPAKPPPKKILI